MAKRTKRIIPGGNSRLPNSALEYVLKSLIPYTEANIKLAFKPALFFNDLEKISANKRRSLQNAYYKAQKAGFIELDDEGVPRLTEKGKRRTQRFVAKQLGEGATLMVIFDIPEREAWKRRHLRQMLHGLGFKQIQKSVWASQFDHRELLQSEVNQLNLHQYVQVYEAVRI